MAADIVFFDGTCNLCNGFVDYLIQRNPPFSFAPLQGPTAEKVLPDHLKHGLSTVVYFRKGEFLTQSEAVTYIFQDLGGHIGLLFLMRILPRAFTDFVYRFISKRRYRLFGKRESCRLPTVREQAYFLP